MAGLMDGRLTARGRRFLRVTALSAWWGLRDLLGGHDLTYASSIAYYALLSFFPCLLLAFSVVGAVTAEPGARAAVSDFVLRYFPQQVRFAGAQLDALATSRLQIGVVGGVTLIWASLGVFNAISSAVNHAWGTTRQGSFWRQRLMAFAMLATAGALLLAALMLSSTIGAADTSWAVTLVARVPGLALLREISARWTATGLLIVVVGLVFYFVPNAPVRFRDVWVGAVVTGLLWKAALAGFSWYLRDLSRFNIVHGSVAAVVVFLVWVYTSAVILLYGAEFTAEYARLLGDAPAPPANPDARA